MSFVAVVLVILGVLGRAVPQAASAGQFQHVVLVSIDGLRPDAIDERADGTTPTLARMLRGPNTMNARADPEITITLPNHICMLTGLCATGDEGHGWVENGDPPAIRHGGTFVKRTGKYVPSMYDVAHDRGAHTGVFVSKTKFWLLTQCYGEAEGAKDLLPPDHGRNKIDVFTYAPESAALAHQAAAWLRQQQSPSLSFVHFSDPDVAGHTLGWDMKPESLYLKGVSTADAALGILVAAIDASENLRGKTALIITSDHGGGEPFKSHTVPSSALNFRIPFLVWLGADTPRLDLAALNADTRARPALEEHVAREDERQPIRSADAGNLALQLLGLPAIPGSKANAKQDLVLGDGAAAAGAPKPAPVP